MWLRGNGLRGEQAEPALRAMLERLYEDATSFGFPEERFDRIYREVELTLYHGTVHARVVVPLRGAAMAADRVDLGGGLSLVRGDLADGPPEAVWPDPLDDGVGGEPAVLCVLERDAPAGDGIAAAEAASRFAAVVTALRLWAPGTVGLGAPAWRRADEGPWQPLPLRVGGEMTGGGARWYAPAAEESEVFAEGATWYLPPGEEQGLAEFFAAVDAAEPPRTVAWALARFEMGSARGRDADALSDYLLALRALLDATSDAGEASLALRVAALCADEGRRRLVQRRIQAAIGLERYVMGGSTRLRTDDDSPRELVAEVETHLRALLRDVLCGYLDADLKSVADDILLETTPEPFMEIRARDLRKESPRFERPAPEPGPRLREEPERQPPPDPDWEPAPEPQPVPEAEPDTSELPAVKPEPPDAQATEQPRLEGVTASADWAWDDPEDYSAPV
jgi:hypothetical protein